MFAHPAGASAGDRGHLQLGQIGSVPVRVHPTVLVGAVLFCGFAWRPAAMVGFVIALLAHEIGHVVAIRACGLRLAGVTFHGAGGTCAWRGPATARQRAVVAWGGVLGQAAVGVAAFLAARALGPAPDGFAAALVEALVARNALLAAFNLLPFPPFDGRDAWRIVRPPRAPTSTAPTTRSAASAGPRARVPGLIAKAKPSPPRPDDELLRYAEQLLRRRKPPTDRSTLN